jgi:peptidoglycan/LPS O-acetylase OafA/YrhL
MRKLLKLELNPNRVYGLDILRALAILFVVLGHSVGFLPSDQIKYINYLVFDGVSIFFVLSGFLIGSILIKILIKDGFTLPIMLNFWKRRWYRTLPNYFLILTIIVGLHYFFVEDFTIKDKLSYYLFSQNLFSPHPSFFPEAWSLSIEEWFYLLIPIFIFLLIKVFNCSAKNAILITAIGIIFSVTLFRYFRFVTTDIDTLKIWDLVFRKQVFTRLDSLMYGIIGAYSYYFKSSLWSRYKLQLLFLGIFLIIADRYNIFNLDALGIYGCVFSFSIVSIATLCLLPYLSNLKSGKGFIYKCITYISLISYSMYLINYVLVKFWIINVIDWSYIESINGYLFIVARYFMYWFFTITISILIYKYFEVPMTKLRDK